MKPLMAMAAEAAEEAGDLTISMDNGTFTAFNANGKYASHWRSIQNTPMIDIDCGKNNMDVNTSNTNRAVGESVAKPWEYYENNIAGTLTLVDVMRKHNVKNIIFSSSATVYGDPAIIPITEECPKGQCTNPYGWTKSMLEQILTDIQKADPEWNVVLLRYFNPIGAHKSGTIGENPNGIPNNLMPYITQVAVGKLKELGVFGNDYDTPDGTGVRDYIHVVDLAKGHVKALKKIEDNSGLSIYNLGTGKGYSVLDIVKNFEAATGVKIPYVIKPRRPGDIATCYSDASKAERELGWKAENGIKEMCADSWRWQSNNPNGYEE